MPDYEGKTITAILNGEYGGLIGDDESAVVTGVASALAVPADADRIALMFSNAGANAILLALKQNNLPASGILLPVNSPPLILSIGFNGGLTRAAWFAASLVGASALHVVSSKRVR
jgi:hypothetical protein